MRGYIESRLDKYIKAEMVSDVEWVRQEIPVSSTRDLALGYAIGTLYMTSATTAMIGSKDSKLLDEDDEIIITMIKRRLPEIIERIERELNV